MVLRKIVKSDKISIKHHTKLTSIYDMIVEYHRLHVSFDSILDKFEKLNINENDESNSNSEMEDEDDEEDDDDDEENSDEMEASLQVQYVDPPFAGPGAAPGAGPGAAAAPKGGAAPGF